MKTMDLTTLIQMDKKYDQATAALNEGFEVNWDDEVHDSFRLLLNRVSDNNSMIHNIATKANNILSRIKNLDIDGLCRSADNLCMEVQRL